MNLRMLVATLVTAGATLFSAGSAMAAAPTPNVTGPVPVTADSYPFLATDIDLSKYGYVEKEYFITGDATRYDLTGANNVTPRRSVPAASSMTASTRSRRASSFAGRPIPPTPTARSWRSGTT